MKFIYYGICHTPQFQQMILAFLQLRPQELCHLLVDILFRCEYQWKYQRSLKYLQLCLSN